MDNKADPLGTVPGGHPNLTDPDRQASPAGASPDPFATESPATAAGLPAAPETAPTDPFATEVPPTSQTAAGPQTSPVSGLRYRVLRSHARGGLGEIFVALDQELGREVALKELQGRHADHPENRARFLLEAEITGNLEHPGIVPIYGQGAYPDGRPYYAMRFIGGDSLQDVIRRFHDADQAGRDPAARALELRQLLGRFVGVCNAIAYAHSRGVIHRDIKPGNIMLGQFGETLVVDWGLAKALGKVEEAIGSAHDTLQPASGSVSGFTRMGSTLGTPSFMSPEQAAGRLDRLGPCSDVYSLGATLYCLLTGKPPFEGSDLAVLLQQVQQGDFRPPRQVKAAVPVALEAVCLKAMALRPEDRYSSAQALADDVEHWLADEPVSAYREPWRLRLRRWGRRHRTVVTAAAALCLTALVGLTIGYVLLAQEQGRTHKAQQERAKDQVGALLNATPQAVPTILDGLAPFQAQVLPRLHALRANRDLPERQRTRASLALLAVDPEQVPYLRERLLAVDNDPEEMLLLCERLLPQRDLVVSWLWTEADRKETAPDRRFRALVALARFDPHHAAWATAGPRVVDPLLAADLLHVGTWAEALAPVRASLLAPLSQVFRDPARSAEAYVAARILRDYAADQPELLADLVEGADVRAFATLLPALRAHGSKAVELLRKELARKPASIWPDEKAAPRLALATEQVRMLEEAGGMVTEEFALCQTLALEQFSGVAESLRRAGYRPIRLRPYRQGQAVRVSAVWARDGRDWQMALGLTETQLRQRDAQLQAQGYAPVDAAGYQAGEGKEVRDLHAALWTRFRGTEEETRLSVAVGGPKQKEVQAALAKEGFVPIAVQTTRGKDGQPRFVGVWWKSPRAPGQWSAGLEESQKDYESRLRDLSVVQLDVHFRSGKAATRGGRYSSVWHPAAALESVGVHGLALDTHIQRCRQLAAQGYRPAALAVAAGTGDRATVAASVWHRPAVTSKARDELASRQANAAAALLRLGEERDIWKLFRHSPDPRLRTYLLHRLSSLGVDPAAVRRRLESEPDVSARRALILSLGTFPVKEMPSELWRPLAPRMLDWYRNDPDPGLHGALDWLLRQRRQGDVPRAVDWGRADALNTIDRELAGPAPVGGRRWYVNKSGQTLAVIPGPVEFLMGSPGHTPQRRLDEPLHRRRIGRTFAIATKVVTVEQFRRFLKAHPEVQHSYPHEVSPDADCPILAVNWYVAAQYCRWLSEQEGVPEAQMCYPPVTDIEKSKDGKAPLRLPADYLSRTGYRLPTEAEWECACRAGTETSRFYGGPEELLTHYAWYAFNAKDRAWPVGQKMPNDLGLFDMQGNVWQWCQSEYRDYPTNAASGPAEDREDNPEILDLTSRVLRGGTFFLHASSLRSAFRLYDRPTYNFMTFSFRVARSCCRAH